MAFFDFLPVEEDVGIQENYSPSSWKRYVSPATAIIHLFNNYNKTISRNTSEAALFE